MSFSSPPFPRLLISPLIQCSGGAVAGFVSQYIGRRLTIMCVSCLPEFHLHLILSSLLQHLRSSRRSFHPPLDHPRFIQQTFRRCLLPPIRRSRVNHHLNQLGNPFTFLSLFRAWGVIPILLSEISPPAFRTTFPGVAYQLGNMVSSASAQIEASEYISLPFVGSL